jgi:LmbE family N-acetylglucosaminyl deacetylase
VSGKPLRVLVLGAHPDDAEFAAGGLLTAHRQQGSVVRMISVTDGRSGHHAMASGELVERRRKEVARAALLMGSEASVWDFPDGYLEPTLALRRRILGEVRTFKPDLVLTHRPWDYHPDHRAVGLAVQDACYRCRKILWSHSSQIPSHPPRHFAPTGC